MSNKTDKNEACGKGSEKSGIKFPCGSFENMLKAFRKCSGETSGDFDCSAIMKKFAEASDGKLECMAAMMQNLCSGKEGSIDCGAVMKELFGSMKEKAK